MAILNLYSFYIRVGSNGQKALEQSIINESVFSQNH